MFNSEWIMLLITKKDRLTTMSIQSLYFQVATLQI